MADKTQKDDKTLLAEQKKRIIENMNSSIPNVSETRLLETIALALIDSVENGK